MTQVDEMPISGQFVAVWVYGGKVWSDAYRWGEEGLERYMSLPEELADKLDMSELWAHMSGTEMLPWGREDDPPSAATFFVM